MTKVTLKVGSTICIVMMLPALWIAFGALATLAYGGRSEMANISIAILATLVPTLCIVGPIRAWRAFDYGHFSATKYWLFSPLIAFATMSAIAIL